MGTKTLSLMLGAALLAVEPLRADVPIADKGQPQAAIVHTGCTGAAEDLQRYLKKITGAALPLAADAAAADALKLPGRIVLEKVDTVPGASERITGRQAYRIRTDGSTLRLIGTPEYGITYAVWGLLEEHLGCRFYAMDESYEIVPQRPTLTLGTIDDFQEPAFMQRMFIFWPGSMPWVVRNRGGGWPADNSPASYGQHIYGQHNFYHLVPPQDQKNDKGDVVRKGWATAHPEWAPMVNGRRIGPTGDFGFCYSNPELAKALADGMRREIGRRQGELAKNPGLTISVTQGDGFTLCECAECRRVARDEESEAGPMFLMINRALERLEKEFPDQQFCTHGYFLTLPAPKHLKPHRNLWINVVSSDVSLNAAGDQVGRIEGNPANRAYAKALADWPKIAPGRVTVWDWKPYQPEWPTIFYTADNVRYMQKCGVSGVYPQICADNWTRLFCWVFLKLAWNPQADQERLVRQFLDDCYGPKAAPHVWEYLKIAQAAYEDSCHVPSAVRWSGFTELTHAKMFAPYLPKMIESMDDALAAAKKESDPACVRRLAEAMGTSIDPVRLAVARQTGEMGTVINPVDGKPWCVAAGDPALPVVLRRVCDGIQMNGGGEHGVERSISWFVGGNGGPVVELKSRAYSAGVCPDLKGQVVSLRHGKQELLASQGIEAGYKDMLPQSTVLWLPSDTPDADLGGQRFLGRAWAGLWSDYKNPAADKLKTLTVMSPMYWGFNANHRMHRSVRLTDAGMVVERSFETVQTDTFAPFPVGFRMRWLLALPEPRLAKVAVKGGGINKMLDLQYAVPGGIKGVKAGERLPGADWMDQRFDDVLAVSDAEPVRLTVDAKVAGDLTVQLDRGDGVAVVLATPAAGWQSLELKPVIEKRHVEVTLVDAAVQVTPEARTAALATQTLGAKAVAVAKAPPSDRSDKADRQARLKTNGRATAINEADGAALVWVPAGEFLRGSPAGQGGGDERPQRKIVLDGYWIYKHPVTLGQYQKFCEATGRKFEPMWGQQAHAEPKGDDGAYAVQCSWYEAEAYAKWAGAALPSEAQWEKAARGTDGRVYPWGNDWDPDRCVSFERTLGSLNYGFLPVGARPKGASPYGVEDMAGNIWEWVADWYDHSYYKVAPDTNPIGPATGVYKVARGGCAYYDERFSRTAARMISPPQVRDWTPIGFRCVVTAPGPATGKGE